MSEPVRCPKCGSMACPSGECRGYGGPYGNLAYELDRPERFGDFETCPVGTCRRLAELEKAAREVADLLADEAVTGVKLSRSRLVAVLRNALKA